MRGIGRNETGPLRLTRLLVGTLTLALGAVLATPLHSLAESYAAEESATTDGASETELLLYEQQSIDTLELATPKDVVLSADGSGSGSRWFGSFTAAEEGSYLFDVTGIKTRCSFYGDPSMTYVLDSDTSKYLEEGETVYLLVSNESSYEITSTIIVSLGKRNIRDCSFVSSSNDIPVEDGEIHPCSAMLVEERWIQHIVDGKLVSEYVERNLEEGTDYIIEGYYDADLGIKLESAPKVAGRYVALYQGINDYAGLADYSFEIRSASDLSTAKVDIDSYYPYTGSPIQPIRSITNAAGVPLIEGTDYKITYSKVYNEENIPLESLPQEIGGYACEISGVEGGSYRGSKSVEFAIIDKAELSLGQEVAASAPDGSWRTFWLGVFTASQAGTYTFECTSDTEVGLMGSLYQDAGLTERLAYDESDGHISVTYALEAGQTVYFKVADNWIYGFTGTVKVTGEIQNNSIETATVSIDDEGLVYTGSALEPAVTVTLDGTVLAADTDYTVSYVNNTNAGTATAVVTGAGNYTGTKSTTFVISPQRVTPTVVLSKTSYVYNTKVQKPALTVEVGSTKLAATSYAVAYGSGRKAVGSYKVTVNLKGNYAGSATKIFTIVPKGTSLTKVAAASKGFTATWKKQATQTSGYQIQYSMSSTFKSGNKTASVVKPTQVTNKVSGLKAKKTYYVRVRTYRKVGGKTYYSAWSTKKAVKTK